MLWDTEVLRYLMQMQQSLIKSSETRPCVSGGGGQSHLESNCSKCGQSDNHLRVLHFIFCPLELIHLDEQPLNKLSTSLIDKNTC